MASYTSNLNLLKKDPQTEGSDTFNIRTMLNDNWDKIDSKIGNPAALWVWEKKNASTQAHIGYVASPSSTAYPTDGTSGGYWYTRLGQIGGGMTKIEVVSYVGTGTYNSGNPCSITASFPIKLAVFIGSRTSSNSSVNTYTYEPALSKTMDTSYRSGDGFSYPPYESDGYGKISSDMKTISWYNRRSADAQRNASGVEYFFYFVG